MIDVLDEQLHYFQDQFLFQLQSSLHHMYSLKPKLHKLVLHQLKTYCQLQLFDH